MTQPRPLVVVLAGPNGAGKTTASKRLLQGALHVHEFVNADMIAAGLSAFRPEAAAVAAGRIMLDRLHALARERQSFAFETTLSSRSFAPWLRELHSDGYYVHLVFLSLPSAEVAIARVQERVHRGGHHIEPEVVRRRYLGGLRNFFRIYVNLADRWRFYDNGNTREPRLIASGGAGTHAEVIDLQAWGKFLELGK